MKGRSIIPWFVAGIAISVAAGALGADAPVAVPKANPSAPPAPSAMTPGMRPGRPAKAPGILFTHALADASGKNLVVVALKFPPKSKGGHPASSICMGHRHPGSVYVYVTQGTARLGIAGEPVQLVHTGESFFEPVGALHTIAESASATEPASAIAVMIVPDGAPLATPACGHR